MYSYICIHIVFKLTKLVNINDVIIGNGGWLNSMSYTPRTELRLWLEPSKVELEPLASAHSYRRPYK